jgi:hypothetical protein
MKKVLGTAVVCALALVFLRCAGGASDVMMPTDVRVSNDLVGFHTGSGIQVDSVHINGLTVGDVTFSSVRAGQTTGYVETDASGTDVQLTIQSLVVRYTVCAGAICAHDSVVVRDVGEWLVEITDKEKNTIVIDSAFIELDSLFGITRVRVRNQLQDVNVQGDSIVEAVMYGIAVDGVDFGDLAGGEESQLVEVPAQSATVTVTIDSLLVSEMSCIGSVCNPQQATLCVDSFDVTVEPYVTNLVGFTATSSETDSLWDNLQACP